MEAEEGWEGAAAVGLRGEEGMEDEAETLEGEEAGLYFYGPYSVEDMLRWLAGTEEISQLLYDFFHI